MGRFIWKGIYFFFLFPFWWILHDSKFSNYYIYCIDINYCTFGNIYLYVYTYEISVSWILFYVFWVSWGWQLILVNCNNYFFLIFLSFVIIYYANKNMNNDKKHNVFYINERFRATNVKENDYFCIYTLTTRWKSPILANYSFGIFLKE